MMCFIVFWYLWLESNQFVVQKMSGETGLMSKPAETRFTRKNDQSQSWQLQQVREATVVMWHGWPVGAQRGSVSGSEHNN